MGFEEENERPRAEYLIKAELNEFNEPEFPKMKQKLRVFLGILSVLVMVIYFDKIF